MPGAAWRRPGDDESNGVQGEPVPAIGGEVGRSAEEEVAELEALLQLPNAVDTSTRLSCARGGSPAEAQSIPKLDRNEVSFVVGERVLSLGGFWRLIVCGLATVLVVVSLTTFLVASTRLSFCFALGTMLVIPGAVGVLAHTGRLTND